MTRAITPVAISLAPPARWPWLTAARSSLAAQLAVLEHLGHRRRPDHCTSVQHLFNGANARGCTKSGIHTPAPSAHARHPVSPSLRPGGKSPASNPGKPKPRHARVRKPVWQDCTPEASPKCAPTYLKAGARNPRTHLPALGRQSSSLPPKTYSSPISQLAALTRARRPSWRHRKEHGGQEPASSWSFTVVRGGVPVALACRSACRTFSLHKYLISDVQVTGPGQVYVPTPRGEDPSAASAVLGRGTLVGRLDSARRLGHA